MAELPRLNGIIKALETSKYAITCFQQAEISIAVEMAQSKYDGVVYEMEHLFWDGRQLRDTLQYSLNRQQIVANGSVAPSVTPLVRIPPNGVEKNQWMAKQALDMGCYGVVWPHISTVDQAYNAISACRYPRLKDKAIHEPMGIRGDGPVQAARYWGVSQPDYYKRADVWPLDPKGEIFTILQIEDTEGIKNLKDILKVGGIGCILIGEGDLSQELGYPRQYEHKVVLEAMAEIVARCKEANVIVGHPHVEIGNAQRILDEGYRFLMCGAPRSYATLDNTRKLVGR